MCLPSGTFVSAPATMFYAFRGSAEARLRNARTGEQSTNFLYIAALVSLHWPSAKNITFSPLGEMRHGILLQTPQVVPEVNCYLCQETCWLSICSGKNVWCHFISCQSGTIPVYQFNIHQHLLIPHSHLSPTPVYCTMYSVHIVSLSNVFGTCYAQLFKIFNNLPFHQQFKQLL